MNDQVTLIGLNNFLDTYDLNADFTGGAPEPGEVLLGLIDSAADGVETRYEHLLLNPATRSM